MAIRIAMWSGPRNISTAMMRSWGNRADTVVIDEPFYAFYLRATGKDHPGAGSDRERRNRLAESRRSDDRPVGPGGNKIFYQKQMTHHLLPEIDRDWLGR